MIFLTISNNYIVFKIDNIQNLVFKFQLIFRNNLSSICDFMRSIKEQKRKQSNIGIQNKYTRYCCQLVTKEIVYPLNFGEKHFYELRRKIEKKSNIDFKL